MQGPRLRLGWGARQMKRIEMFLLVRGKWTRHGMLLLGGCFEMYSVLLGVLCLLQDSWNGDDIGNGMKYVDGNQLGMSLACRVAGPDIVQYRVRRAWAVGSQSVTRPDNGNTKFLGIEPQALGSFLVRNKVQLHPY